MSNGKSTDRGDNSLERYVKGDSSVHFHFGIVDTGGGKKKFGDYCTVIGCWVGGESNLLDANLGSAGRSRVIDIDVDAPEGMIRHQRCQQFVFIPGVQFLKYPEEV
jgi:hypothetical protein